MIAITINYEFGAAICACLFCLVLGIWIGRATAWRSWP